MDILVSVSKQKLRIETNLKSLVAGTQEFIRFIFNLTSDWDGLMVFAQFLQDGVAYNQYLDDDNAVYLPAEIGPGTVTIMLYGSGDTVIGTTNYLTLTVDENILVSDANSTEISESLYTQLVAKINTLTAWSEQDSADVTAAYKELQIELATKADQDDLDAEITRAKAAEAALESTLTLKASQSEVDELTLRLTELENDEVIASAIEDAVATELAEYLSSGQLASMVIEDGSITRSKVDEDFEATLALADTAMQPDVYDPQGLAVDIFSYAKAKADTVQLDVDDLREEIQDAYALTDTLVYTNIGDTIKGAVALSRTYAQALLADYKAFTVTIVDELPTVGSSMTFYLLPNSSGTGYDKYWWITDDDGNSSWDVFGSSSTLIVDELPEIGDEDCDYILKTTGGYLYYKYISGYWEVIAGSVASISSTLPDEGNGYTDYYVLNESGSYVHYRYINGAFKVIGGDTYTRDEIDIMMAELNEADTSLASRVSDVESTAATLTTEMDKLSNAVADVTNENNVLTISYMDGATKEITIEAGTTIDSWAQDSDGYLHLYDADGNDIIDPILIAGGGGSGTSTSGSATITRITSASTQCIYGDDMNIEFNFEAVDSSGDLVGSGTGTWYVGGIVKATSTVAQGANSFNIGSYLSSGTNTVKVSVSVDTGGESNTVVTKTWTVNAVNMYFTWSYDDAQINTAAITDRYTPYGDVSKTTYTYIDGELLDESTTSRSGVSQSLTIPMQTHGAHMVERYVTATVGGSEITTDSQYHDMIFVVAGDTTPIIACSYNGGSMMQYNTIQIPVVIYTPSSLTSDATLYVDGEQIATWSGIDRTVHYWNYSPSTSGTKTLTITSGETSKTITIEVEALDIDVEEITGYDFRFKASDFATNDAVQAWTSDDNTVDITFSDNFDWTNGGLQTETDDDGNLRQYLCVKAGTTATVNYQLFADDAKKNGKSFKFIYKAVNCRDYDAQVLSCLESGIGLVVQAQGATFTTEQNTLETITCKDDYIEFELNIHPDSEYRYLSFIMDGCYDRLTLYAANDNMTQGSPVYITIGSDDCDVYVYMVKAYSTYMTNENICDNFIVDAPNAYDMVDRYDRNNILNESGEISYEKLYTQNPECRVLLLDVPRMTNGKKDSVTGCTVRHIYSAGGNSHCWNAENVTIKGQGTSSENYGDSARNLDLQFTEGFTFDDGTTADTYSMTDESIGINYMNVKLNVASSECCNNACIADWYNTFQPYQSANRAADSMARDTMEFHPCAVFIRDQSCSLVGFEDGEYHLYGIGDCGNSKKNTQVFHDTTNENECCVEVLNNTNSLCLMQSCDFSGEDFSGDYSFEFRYPSSPTDEMKEAWIRFVTFMCEHDPNQATNEALDEEVTYGAYTFSDDCEILGGTTIDTYAGTYTTDSYEYRMADLLEHCEEYMVMDSVVFHFVFIESLGMIDNVVKNTFWSTSDLIHWDLTKDYDNDTALGNDNEGGMTIPYGTETDDTKGDGHAFNGYNAVWCEFVRNLYAARAAMYINRETAGCWDTETFLAKLSDYQDTRPERVWIADTQRKYLRPYEGEGTESYISMLNGKKTHQRRQFKFYNEYYFSSCYIGSTCTSQLITVRCYTPETWTGVEPANSIDITMYANCYIVIRAASTTKRIRAERGVTYTLAFDEAGTLNDTETYFYLAPMIQKIGDMAHLYIGYCNFAYATLLQEISIGSDAEGYTNNNLTSISFGNNTMLEYLQIQNCPNVTSSLDLTGCQSLKTLLLGGSGFTGIAIATGGLLETAQLPSPASLTLRELNYLTDDGFSMESYENLKTLRLESCPYLDSLAIVQAATGLTRLRLVDIDWTLSSTDLLNTLVTLAGLDESEYNTTVSVLTGTVYISGSIRSQELLNYANAWDNLVVTYDSANLVTQYLATYVNADGSYLYEIYVDRGDVPIDPVGTGAIDTPTMASTAQYDYTFSGWDDITSTMLAARTITAEYDETIRQYTITWYSRAGLSLGSTTAEYGSEVVYDGDTPTNTEEESSYVYNLFTGWDKSTGYITGDTDVYAVWDRGEYPSTSTSLSDMSTSQIYGLTVRNNSVSPSSSSNIMSTFCTTKDRITINMGRDYTFDNVESHTLVEMGKDLVLDGTDDTVKEFAYTPMDSTDNGFTMMIDYEYTDTSVVDGTLVSCFDFDGYKGFRLRYNSGPNIQWGNVNAAIGNTRYRNVLVIRKKPNSSQLYYYTFNGTTASGYFSDEPTSASFTRSTSYVTTQPIVLGAIKYTDTGTYDYHGSGVIHFCKFWMADLGDAVAQDMVTWYRQPMVFEYIDTGVYRLASSNAYYTNASFICAEMPQLVMYMNSTSDNTGGWDACYMRQWLNPSYDLYDDNHATTYEGYGRIYNGMPIEWRSIIKRTRIPTNHGNADKTVVLSYDYMYLPSQVEMNNTSSDTYASEGSYITWFTSDILRAKFRGRLVPEDAAYYTMETDPADSGYTLNEGDVWKVTSSTVYIYVSADTIANYRMSDSTSRPSNYSYTASSAGGGWVSAYYWWLRSAYMSGTTAFYYVGSGGGVYYDYGGASHRYGVCPCFSI